jgi:hypothetical protein
MRTNLATPGQLKAIHTASRRIFNTDDDYRSWLFDNYGVFSASNLKMGEASQAIGLLQKITGYKSKFTYTPKRPGRITVYQINRIVSLTILLDWHKQTFRIDGFIKRQTGKSTTVKMLTSHEAQKIIIGLQRIIANGSDDIYRYLNTVTFADPETPAGQALLKAVNMRLKNVKY